MMGKYTSTTGTAKRAAGVDGSGRIVYTVGKGMRWGVSDAANMLAKQI